jgi:molybdopterin converting factor subunit 1
MKINVKYFASFRDKTGVSSETIETTEQSISELFIELNQKYDFPLNKEQIKVACNEEYVSFETLIKDNDTIVFIPPVAGG